jgi:hypothetical protein
MVTVERGKQGPLNNAKEIRQMYKVTYRFFGEVKTYTETASSAGLASIDADPLVEIIEIEKVGA